MSDDELICYLVTVMPLDQWHQVAMVMNKVIEQGHGTVTITVRGGKMFKIDSTTSEWIREKDKDESQV